MQYIENDMDDLFRKAAENYPLKANAKNWDDLTPVLVNATGASVSPNTGKRKWSLLALFFFLLTSAILMVIPVSNTNKININPVKNESIFDQNNASVEIVTDKDASLNSNKNVFPSTGSQINHSGNNWDHLQTDNVTENENSRISVLLKSKKKNKRKMNAYTSTKISVPAAADHDVTVLNEMDNKSKIPEIELTENNRQSEEVQSNDTELLLPEKEVVSEKQNTDSQEKKKNQGHKMYWGIAGGPQWNQVKSQGLNKAGISLGLIAGFQFTKKLSVETGVYYSKKYYYSDGKYFHMKSSDPSMPANMEIINLEGSSNIFEIPVRIKYDFVQNKKANLFITSGITSYIMSKESNNYFALANGTQMNMKAAYYNKTGYFLADANFSLGYEFITGPKTSIRIEPYLQIPLKGIGIGSMRVMTTGLHIGMTRSLSR